MTAFLLLTIGSSRTMAHRIATKFGDAHSPLSPSSWIVRADDGVTPREIAERIDARSNREEVIVLSLDAATLDAHAEPSLLSWFKRTCVPKFSETN